MLGGAFDELVERHIGSLSTYARAVCGDRWAAEDAVQETLLRAWRYRDTFAGRGSLEGWLLRICHNCIVDAANRRGRPAPFDDRDAPVEHPDHSTEVLALVEALPASQREVVALCGLLGYDYESAAAILEVPVGTVRSRLSRARASMSDAIAATDEIA